MRPEREEGYPAENRPLPFQADDLRLLRVQPVKSQSTQKRERGGLVSRGTAVRIRFGSPFSSEAVVCGHCLLTLSLTFMKQ